MIAPQPSGSVNDGRKVVRPVIAVASEVAHAQHQGAPSVCNRRVDFVDPDRAGRWSGYLRRQAGFDEAEMICAAS